MRKTVILLLALFMAFGAVCAQGAEEKTYEIVKREFPLYIGSIQNLQEDPFPLYFINGADDIPYIDLEDFLGLFAELYPFFTSDPEFNAVLQSDGPEVSLVRNNGYYMALNVDTDTITFNDYNAFRQKSNSENLMDILSLSDFDEDGVPVLFLRDKNASYDRYGDMYRLDLAAYGIDLAAQDGRYYAPLQTMSDILIAPTLKIMALFNGETLILANGNHLGNVKYGLTPLGELYYSAEPGERSEALAEFGYNELCLALDNLYGLKEIHDIQSFDGIFHEIAYDQLLKSQNPYYADEALNYFIGYFLDDLHSEFKGYSWQTGAKEYALHRGSTGTKMLDAWDIYGEAREAVYGSSYPTYEEVGNTAYITFDDFMLYTDSGDYYAYTDGMEFPENDTIALIIYAHDQITRENSPIENVVLDLSNNGGGAADAAIVVMSWLLGEAPVTLKDMNTGAATTAIYRADVNLDHQFDEKDTVADKNIYCLISPVSFSCGNLVPAVLKASDKVTLLGRPSGGGSCIVQNLSTAWGTVFQISGSTRLSFSKNGSFYDIDQGVAPDYLISKPENYYDREKLTDFINHNIF